MVFPINKWDLANELATVPKWDSTVKWDAKDDTTAGERQVEYCDFSTMFED